MDGYDKLAMKKLLSILIILPILALADPPTTNYPVLHYDPSSGGFVPSTTNGHTVGTGGSGTVTVTGSTPADGDFSIFSGASSIRKATNSEVPILDASGSWVPYFDSTIYKRLLFDTPFTIVDSGSDKLISVDLSNYLTLDGDGQNVTVNGNALGDWFGATGQNIANLFTGATTATFGAINGNTIGAGSTSGTNTGDQTITLTGNVTGSGTGSFAATIANSAVTLAKMADMATSSLIYRKTSGTGAPEVNTLATLKTDLGLTGTNSGDQTITLTGDVTGSGTGSFATTLGTVAVAKGGTNITSYAIGDLIYASASTTLSKLADVATGSVLISGGVTTAPAWSTTPTFVGTNISGTAASLTAGNVTTNANLTGDVTSSGNATTLATTQSAVHTWSAAQTDSKSGAASVSALTLSGVPFAGTGTTSFPLLYINDANATASTTLSTAGTYFGVNGDGTQDLMNLLKDGTSQFKVSSTGTVTLAGDSTINGGSFVNLNVGGTTKFGIGGASLAAAVDLYSQNDGGSALGTSGHGWNKFFLYSTVTTGGTTGAQTINKPSGTVNFAAAASSLVVTDSLVSTSSTIYCSIRTNDTTALIKNVVPGAGSFTITLNAAATAETSVGFFVVN